MRFFLSLLLVVLSVNAHASGLAGTWQYYKKIFDGVEMPEPPEATLRLFFAFDEQGKSRLYWWHEGEHDFCERIGQYFWDGAILTDKIIWVNPKNSAECYKDPDMQLGKTTKTPTKIINGEMYFYLNLGDSSLTYVWKQTEGAVDEVPIDFAFY